MSTCQPTLCSIDELCTLRLLTYLQRGSRSSSCTPCLYYIGVCWHIYKWDPNYSFHRLYCTQHCIIALITVLSVVARSTSVVSAVSPCTTYIRQPHEWLNQAFQYLVPLFFDGAFSSSHLTWTSRFDHCSERDRTGDLQVHECLSLVDSSQSAATAHTLFACEEPHAYAQIQLWRPNHDHLLEKKRHQSASTLTKQKIGLPETNKKRKNDIIYHKWNIRHEYVYSRRDLTYSLAFTVWSCS